MNVYTCSHVSTAASPTPLPRTANTNRASEDGGLQSIEVVCVHPPGRGSRQSEDPVRDMGAYVTSVCDAMALYFDRPFG
jgi:surfactin synthase thioesterase subunit